MNQREKDRAFAPLRIVESYWHGLRSDEHVPLRSQIDPRGIEDALEFAFLAEKLGPTLAKLRVAGGHLKDLMGMEVAGMPLSALFTPDARNQLAEAVPHLFSDPAIIRISLKGESGMGRPQIDGELLMLPLRSDMDDVTRALGCLVTHGSVGRRPRRFDITDVRIEHALSSDALPILTPRDTDTYRPAQPQPPVRGFAEDRAEFVQKPTKAPHLRIVVSND